MWFLVLLFGMGFLSHMIKTNLLKTLFYERQYWVCFVNSNPHIQKIIFDAEGPEHCQSP